MSEYRQMRTECKEEFEKLHRRIDKRDKMLNGQDDELKKHGVAIAKISEDVAHVTRSMNSLTRALWGLAGSMMVTLVGFVLWYIQSL